MNEDVLFEIDGQIAVITLNRPQKLNAVTPEMADAIVAAVKRMQRQRHHPLRDRHGRRRPGVLRRLRHPRARHLRDARGSSATAPTIATRSARC